MVALGPGMPPAPFGAFAVVPVVELELGFFSMVGLLSPPPMPLPIPLPIPPPIPEALFDATGIVEDAAAEAV